LSSTISCLFPYTTLFRSHVVVNYYSSGEAARETVAAAEQLGVEAMAVQCDVADWGSVRQMADSIQARFGGLDIIVNSASLFDKIDRKSTRLNSSHVKISY